MKPLTHRSGHAPVNPATILLGIGYATSLCVAIGWLAALVV